MKGRLQERLPNAAGPAWLARHCALSLFLLQILLLAFLKLIDEGSHMVMLECPETVNTLLHEFLLWEPEPPPKALLMPPEEKK